jgi:DHA1 family tetracycline resistance protein-like MFS transporter
MALGIVIPVLPQLIQEFTGSNARAGLINGVFIAGWAVMQFIFSPLIGSLSDRFGRRPIILISSAGLAVDYVLVALAPNLWWLVAARLLGGITTASFSTASAYLADVTPPEGRAKAYGLIGAAWSAGFVAGPLLGGVLGDWSLRAPFWAAAALSAAAFAYGLFVLPESLPADRRMPFSWRRANPLGSLKLLRSHPELSGLASVNFLLWFSHHVFTAVFVLYAAHRYQWGPSQVGLVLALVGVLDMVVQGLLTGRMVKRFGDARVMIIGLLGGAAGLAAMGAAPTGWWFIAAMLPNALWGLSMPTLQSLMTRRVSESEQGQLQGANSSVQSIAGIASPLFFGWVYSLSIDGSHGIGASGTPFFISAAVLLSAAVLGWRVATGARKALQSVTA